MKGTRPVLSETTVQLSDIRTDGGTQTRAAIQQDVVTDYADALEAGEHLPPVTLYHDGTIYWLADGFHRVEAHKKLGALEIEADVRQGARRDAVLHSVGANATHGLRRTNEDKRRAVQVLLEDEEWREWSDREIARRAGVHHDTVGRLRGEVTGGNRQSEIRKGADGRTINTANIGKPKSEAPLAPPPPEVITYSPPLTPDEPEEDDRPAYDPYDDENQLEPITPDAEIVTDDLEEEDEPYIPPHVSNPQPSTFQVREVPGPKPKEPPYVEWTLAIGKLQGKGHRSLIAALNSSENQAMDNALETNVDDLIEMLRASKKQAEIERKTVTV